MPGAARKRRTAGVCRRRCGIERPEPIALEWAHRSAPEDRRHGWSGLRILRARRASIRSFLRPLRGNDVARPTPRADPDRPALAGPSRPRAFHHGPGGVRSVAIGLPRRPGEPPSEFRAGPVVVSAGVSSAVVRAVPRRDYGRSHRRDRCGNRTRAHCDGSPTIQSFHHAGLTAARPIGR